MDLVLDVGYLEKISCRFISFFVKHPNISNNWKKAIHPLLNTREVVNKYLVTEKQSLYRFAVPQKKCCAEILPWAEGLSLRSSAVASKTKRKHGRVCGCLFAGKNVWTCNSFLLLICVFTPPRISRQYMAGKRQSRRTVRKK